MHLCGEKKKKIQEKCVCVCSSFLLSAIFVIQPYPSHWMCWNKSMKTNNYPILFQCFIFCYLICLPYYSSVFFFSPFVTQCFLHCIWITTACVCESMFVISFPYLVKKIKRFAFLFQLFKCMRECNNHTINTHRWIHT